jgi:hypothetical protein
MNNKENINKLEEIEKKNIKKRERERDVDERVNENHIKL